MQVLCGRPEEGFSPIADELGQALNCCLPGKIAEVGSIASTGDISVDGLRKPRDERQDRLFGAGIKAEPAQVFSEPTRTSGQGKLGEQPNRIGKGWVALR